MGELKRLQMSLIRRQMALIDELRRPDTSLDPLKAFWTHNFNVMTGESGPMDYRKLKGFGSFVDVYNAAKSNRDKGRIGRGIAGLGSKFKTAYAEDLATEADFNKSILAAGGLEQAYRQILPSSIQGIMQIAGQNTNRLGMAMSGIQGASGTLSDMLSRPSFAQQLLLGGVGAAGNIISAVV